MEFGSSLDDLLRVQDEIRASNRRLSQRFEEALSASPTLRQLENSFIDTPTHSNNNTDYLEEVPEGSLTVRKAACTRKRTEAGFLKIDLELGST